MAHEAASLIQTSGMSEPDTDIGHVPGRWAVTPLVRLRVAMGAFDDGAGDDLQYRLGRLAEHSVVHRARYVKRQNLGPGT